MYQPQSKFCISGKTIKRPYFQKHLKYKIFFVKKQSDLKGGVKLWTQVLDMWSVIDTATPKHTIRHNFPNFLFFWNLGDGSLFDVGGLKSSVAISTYLFSAECVGHDQCHLLIYPFPQQSLAGKQQSSLHLFQTLSGT